MVVQRLQRDARGETQGECHAPVERHLRRGDEDQQGVQEDGAEEAEAESARRRTAGEEPCVSAREKEESGALDEERPAAYPVREAIEAVESADEGRAAEM